MDHLCFFFFPKGTGPQKERNLRMDSSSGKKGKKTREEGREGGTEGVRTNPIRVAAK